jgi:protein ImuB
MKDLVHALVRHGVGARALRLALYRVDGEVTTIDVSLTMPTRDPAHVTRLFDLKLERITEAVEFGFGFETLGLAATIVEPIEPTQTALAPATDGHNAEDGAALVDRLQQRLGPRSVRRLAPVASHLPERAEMAVADAMAAWPVPQATRPLFLLSNAEPADVLALVPEGPPQRFRWRGVIHDVAHAQGPERIASEWWRSSQPTRDYYLVEDDGGRRFWLYREGLYERETKAPRWFVQGLFA